MVDLVFQSYYNNEYKWNTTFVVYLQRQTKYTLPMYHNLQLLFKMWKEFEERIDQRPPKINTAVQNLASIFTFGQNYLFKITIKDLKLIEVQESYKEIHGAENFPEKLGDLMDLIHPDDMEFIIFAERWGLKKLLKSDDLSRHKIGYFIRMRVKDGSYGIFFHQTYYLRDNLKTKFKECVYSHTYFKDVVSTMSYEIKIYDTDTNKIVHHTIFIPSQNLIFNRLTPRELEVLKLIAKGMTDKEISEELFLSYNTVRTHRKNILRKTETKNSIELMKRCNEIGLS